MYCLKCGAKISDKARFCPACGSKQEEYIVKQPVKESENTKIAIIEDNGITRQAEVIYIKSLRDLYYARFFAENRCREELGYLEREIKKYEKPIPRSFKGAKSSSANEVTGIVFLLLFMLLGSLFIVAVLPPLGIIGLIMSVWLLIEYPAEVNKQVELEKEAKKFNEEEEERVRKLQVEYDEKLDKLFAKHDEKSAYWKHQFNVLDARIEQTYSLNIIPKQRRTPEAIIYLYEWMAFSYQSLESALFSSQLDEGIKKILNKLDEIKSELSDINSTIEYIQFQNDKQIENNKKILNSLVEVEKNQQISHRYAEIENEYLRNIEFYNQMEWLRKIKI